MLYFDHNATAPLSRAAREAWLDAQDRFPANPASLHRVGQRAEAALEDARSTLAGHLGAPAEALVFTSGATEAASAVFSHLAAVSPLGGGVWLSAIEHPCVLAAAARYFSGRVCLLPVTAGGVLDLQAFRERLACSPRPVAVSLMAANNETGVLQPWREVASMCQNAGVAFVCDATQWIGRLPADGLGECDFVFASGHKWGAPVGVGFLKAPSTFHPLHVGGSQEDGRRAGTQSVAGALAFVAALKDCASRFSELPARAAGRAAVEAELVGFLPGARVLGAGVPRLWNTVSLVAPELRDCRRRWVVLLDAAGVAASSGSACSSGKEAASHVLGAMGLGAEVSDRVLRLSGGWDTPEVDWLAVAGKLAGIWGRLGSK